MSASTMRSGRGRLPGMGAAVTPPPSDTSDDTPTAEAAAAPSEQGATSAAKPPRRRVSSAARRSRARRADGEEQPEETYGQPERAVPFPPYAPRQGEPKVQVNPRIYQGIWRRYEELIDELPRERRRGALTALVNAVLAAHAPHDVDEARAAITWLRQAEARDATAEGRRQR